MEKTAYCVQHSSCVAKALTEFVGQVLSQQCETAGQKVVTCVLTRVPVEDVHKRQRRMMIQRWKVPIFGVVGTISVEARPRLGRLLAPSGNDNYQLLGLALWRRAGRTGCVASCVVQTGVEMAIK